MKLQTAAEAAIALDVSRQRVYQLIDQGRIRVWREHPYMIREADVAKFVRRPPGRQSK